MEVQKKFLKGRRLRVFAGPNGSGKSTIFNQVSSDFNIGIYINPDEIANQLISSGEINLLDFEVQRPFKISFQKFLRESKLSAKASIEGVPLNLTLERSIIRTSSREVNYEASFLAEFLRENLLRQGKRVTFETVLVHQSKIDILKFSLSRGYKNYLYFVGTESPLINIDRVRQRVLQGGHNVDVEKISERYFRSMSFLKDATSFSYRAFIFDNSGKEAELIMEIFMGKEITFHSKQVPVWVDKYYFE